MSSRVRPEHAEARSITCAFCGFVYEPASCTTTCGGCPLGKACAMAACPRCGYRTPAESRLGKLLKGLAARIETARTTPRSAEWTRGGER